MTERQFSYILFDAGGTLIGTNTDSEYWFEQFFVDVCAEQGSVVSVHDVHEVLRRAVKSRHFDNRCSSDLQAREFWEYIYKTAFSDLLGARTMNHHHPSFVDHLASDYIDRFEAGEFVRLFPDARDGLEQLKSFGIPMGIVSNFSTYLTKFLQKLEIDHYFEFTLISAGEGCEKPGDDIFKLAISRCNGVPPEKILYIGDSIDEDYKPAERHGLYPLLIDRHDRHVQDASLNRINTISQVCEILGRKKHQAK